MTLTMHIRRLLAILLGILALTLFATPAWADNPVSFSGGTCTLIDSQANGIRVDFCTNLSGVAVDDIHVTFSYTGLPNSTIDYNQNLLCSFTGTCFGPEVPNGGRWEGGNGGKGEVENPTLWSAGTMALITDFNIANVTASGYWTKGGKQVTPVPEPAAWSMMLLGLAMIGVMLRVRPIGVLKRALSS